MIMPNVPIISRNQIRDVTYMFVDGRMVVAIEHSVSDKNLVLISLYFVQIVLGPTWASRILGNLL